jgi:hypothetical protein
MIRDRLVVFCVLCFLRAVAFADGDTPLLWNSAPDRQNCPDTASYLWIGHADGMDCVRYFAGRDLNDAPVVIVIFSGDRDRIMRRSPDEILNNTRRSKESVAAKLSKQAGIPVLILARPGTYGSSGDHRKRRQLREFLALEGALSTLKLRYRVGQYVLLGHSGGATAAAAMLTLGRADILCAVLTSGAFDLLERSRRRAFSTGKSPPINRDAIGLVTLYDPLYEVDGIVSDASRRIYVLGNSRDSVTPFDLQKKFADAVARAGHQVELHEVEARGPRFHDLLSNKGMKTASNCAR